MAFLLMSGLLAFSSIQHRRSVDGCLNRRCNLLISVSVRKYIVFAVWFRKNYGCPYFLSISMMVVSLEETILFIILL